MLQIPGRGRATKSELRALRNPKDLRSFCAHKWETSFTSFGITAWVPIAGAIRPADLEWTLEAKGHY